MIRLNERSRNLGFYLQRPALFVSCSRSFSPLKKAKVCRGHFRPSEQLYAEFERCLDIYIYSIPCVKSTKPRRVTNLVCTTITFRPAQIHEPPTPLANVRVCRCYTRTRMYVRWTVGDPARPNGGEMKFPQSHFYYFLEDFRNVASTDTRSSVEKEKEVVVAKKEESKGELENERTETLENFSIRFAPSQSSSKGRNWRSLWTSRYLASLMAFSVTARKKYVFTNSCGTRSYLSTPCLYALCVL